MSIQSRRKPVVALAMGDPAGISPELTAKLAALEEVRQAAALVVIGDRRVFGQGARVRLVAERVVVEDRVRAEQHERGPLEPGGRLVVLDELDLEAGRAQLLGELSALVLR